MDIVRAAHWRCWSVPARAPHVVAHHGRARLCRDFGRDFVTPDDIKVMAQPVLEHRIILRPEFEIEGLSVAEVIQQILQQIAVPR